LPWTLHDVDDDLPFLVPPWDKDTTLSSLSENWGSLHRLGFDIQGKIWQAVGKQEKTYDIEKIFESFSQEVGWNVMGNFWGRRFKNDTSGIYIEGNLPFKINLHVTPQGLPYITERLQFCRINAFRQSSQKSFTGDGNIMQPANRPLETGSWDYWCWW
jgi:hypothetical protein